MKLLSFAFVILGLAALVAAQSKSIAQIAIDNNFNTLVAALKAANLVTALSCTSYCFPKYTVFAPTDAAFAALPSGLVKKLTTDTQYSLHLKQLLQYHLVKGKVLSTGITNGAKLTTVQGGTITATKKSGNIFINGNAKVVLADVLATNGVVHAVDNVLVPSFLNNDLVAVAASQPRFSTLVAAVKAAGLVSTLQGTGPFTIFAPNNAAFNKLGQSTINSLLANPTKLAKILKYHVVSGIITSDKLKSGSVTTVEGGLIKVTVGASCVHLNGNSRIVATDILASNGVIHVIVSVFLSKYLFFFETTAG